ncbi:hypothetical protein VST7929_02793 [Vibrio stylophorae]|uniref:Uncharacterized protein n=1 Tax=Vibrio stylophorae TaxID=659351 RepID=A0ABM8ZWV8_9VIBR|nr:hypothetical protein [Vibrio stylophorae]CAH0535132.1 hypothetical protein VST7929_02793 [Vibrio stylophorae]
MSEHLSQFEDNHHSQAVGREIQLLINLLEPDPALQPTWVSDEDCFFDICTLTRKEIEEKLRIYFRGELPADVSLPLWRFIAKVQEQYPSWPAFWPLYH